MLVAAKPMSIGDFQLKAGDPITPEIESALPAGRIQKLEAAGWVRSAADDTLGLEDRVSKLEAQVAQLIQQIKTRAPRAPETQE